MITPQMRALARKVSEFARSHGIRLTENEALDLTGHLLCDEMMDVVENDPPDWHCILWNRDAAATGEVYSLCHNAPTALAAVENHAVSEMHDLDEVELAGTELMVYSEGELYARIRRPEWVKPNPTTYRRMATLVSPLRIWEEQRLHEALSTLPAWQVERYNNGPTWLPEGHKKPERRGEWLPRLSENMTPGAALEQNLLPMWPTPNAMAATLHRQLSERAAGRLKLAHCQEGLATILGVGSWQVLLARFRANSFPQVMLQTVDEASAEPGIRLYKGPVELLAWTYDLALQRKAANASPLFVQVSWSNSFRLALTHRLMSWSDLHRAVSAKCTVPSDLWTEESVRWDKVTLGVAEEAQQWTDYGYSGIDVLNASDEDIDVARQNLNELGYS